MKRRGRAIRRDHRQKRDPRRPRGAAGDGGRKARARKEEGGKAHGPVRGDIQSDRRPYTARKDDSEKTPHTCPPAAFPQRGRKKATRIRDVPHRRRSVLPGFSGRRPDWRRAGQGTRRLLARAARARRMAAASRRESAKTGQPPRLAILLDGVPALVERVGTDDRGPRPRGLARSSTPQRSSIFSPHLSDVPSPSGRPPPRPRRQPQGARPRKGANPRVRLMDRDCVISRHLSGKRGRKKSPTAVFGPVGESPGEERGKRRKRKKGRVLASLRRDQFCGLLLPRPAPPGKKGRPDSPPGPFR